MAPPTPTALYEDQPFQRRSRDSNAITAHIQVSPATWETTGRILLGRSGKRARGERAGEDFGRRREEAGGASSRLPGSRHTPVASCTSVSPAR
ncbi:hypothetical protein [Streptomyces sp. NPDC093591]|uniref:hypothetical protein n=1 Tax=Streptomyces sp. NPDC093591 TaxID=3366044 RepID=UPI00381C6A0E